MAKKNDTPNVDEQQNELLADLQRTRADFENYRKRSELEKKQALEAGESRAVLKLLPVIDTIERAIVHIPDDIAEHQWVQGVAGLVKQLDKSLAGMDLKRIPAKPGDAFNPELHQAIQFDEEAEGDTEVVADELQAGYTLKGTPIRHAMVRVTKK
jgi:molecular chaperone GrpE